MIMIVMVIMMIMTHLVYDGQLPGQVVQTISGEARLDNRLELRQDLPEITRSERRAGETLIGQLIS